MMGEDIFKYNFNDDEYVTFRLLSNEDSIEELTHLLNRSYKILADMGLNYVAASQNCDITLNRVRSAYKCYIGVYKNKIVSTLSLYSPKSSDKGSWYSKDFVAKIGQFAVEPELQKYGMGNKMMDFIEDEARNMKNIKEIALDTAETAHHLINFYKKRNYRYIETIQWNETNYKSVVLSKVL